MWLVRHRFWQSGHIFAVCSLILAAGFMLQIRVLYHNHLKQQRYQEYRETVRHVNYYYIASTLHRLLSIYK